MVFTFFLVHFSILLLVFFIKTFIKLIPTSSFYRGGNSWVAGIRLLIFHSRWSKTEFAASRDWSSQSSLSREKYWKTERGKIHREKMKIKMRKFSFWKARSEYLRMFLWRFAVHLGFLISAMPQQGRTWFLKNFFYLIYEKWNWLNFYFW